MPSERSESDKELVEAYRTAGEILWWVSSWIPFGNVHLVWSNGSFEFTWTGRSAGRQYGMIQAVLLTEIRDSKDSAEEHGKLIARRFNNLITESMKKEGIH